MTMVEAVALGAAFAGFISCAAIFGAVVICNFIDRRKK